MRRWSRRTGGALALAGAAWLLAPRAGAAPPLALDRVDAPAPGGPHLLTPAPEPSAGALAVALLGEHAWRPLVLVDPTTDEPREVLVAGQTVLHLALAFGPTPWLGLELGLPLALAQAGDGAATGFSLQRPGDGVPGDLRLGARVLALHGEGAAPGVSLGLRAWLPTGGATSYLTAGTTRLAPTLDAGGRVVGLAWALSLQRRSAPWQGGGAVVPPHEWLLSAGVSAPLGAGFSAGPELLASTQEGEGDGAFGARGAGLEAFATARWTGQPLWAAAGVGAGLGNGVGTPEARVLLQAGVALDTGLGRSGAETPAAPAPTASAPPADAPADDDRDGDTVADAVDACPDQVGDATPTAPRRGCPTRSLAEACAAGLPPPGERCPEAAPTDTDGDGIVDPLDACPAERGTASEDPKRHGCPRSVRVEAGQIVITEQVQFATGSDRIEPQSFPVLQQVADALAAHPEIARVAVDGHTDDAGLPLANLDLSRRRAMAVLRWLTAQGVDERRLEARGFGQRQPLVRERTPEARARNRRVEFQILERTERGAAGWHDGPVEREGAP